MTKITSIAANEVVGVICPHCGEKHKPHYDHLQYLQGDEGQSDACGVFFYCRKHHKRFAAIFTLFRLVQGQYTQDFIGVEQWTERDLSQ